MQRLLGLFLFGLLGAARLAEHVGGVDALLDEDLENLHLGGFVERFRRIDFHAS